MANVRVYNDNTYPYSEDFREHKINIPPKGFIMMEEHDALVFKGTMNQIKKDADGQPLPISFKMIRIEKLADEPAAVEEKSTPVCQACRYEASSEKDLSEHISANHKDISVVDEEAEKFAAEKKKKMAR